MTTLDNKIKENECLEFLSDEVRKGNPIDFFEALEVIEYQEKLKEEKKNKKTFKNFICKNFKKKEILQSFRYKK